MANLDSGQVAVAITLPIEPQEILHEGRARRANRFSSVSRAVRVQRYLKSVGVTLDKFHAGLTGTPLKCEIYWRQPDKTSLEIILCVFGIAGVAEGLFNDSVPDPSATAVEIIQSSLEICRHESEIQAAGLAPVRQVLDTAPILQTARNEKTVTAGCRQLFSVADACQPLLADGPSEMLLNGGLVALPTRSSAIANSAIGDSTELVATIDQPSRQSSTCSLCPWNSNGNSSTRTNQGNGAKKIIAEFSPRLLDDVGRAFLDGNAYVVRGAYFDAPKGVAFRLEAVMEKFALPLVA